MAPALLCIPSTFQMVCSFLRLALPIFNLFKSLSLMKLSVAPESTRTCLSALEYKLCKRVGIHSDLYLHLKIIHNPRMHAQATGGIHFKNPLLLTALIAFCRIWTFPFSGPALAFLIKVSAQSSSDSSLEDSSALSSSVSAMCALVGAFPLGFFFSLSGQFLERWPCLLQVKQWPSQRWFSSMSEAVASLAWAFFFF